ncbi:hypothetical protein F9C07_2766 [Aspergillus flavus]|uniref:Uncharacterized protein n=1 Tax=Aspergillus flavus (strain ATCC 200026 / FGSC A1120 / IAM 13836 / NRRL 3357 / JCM 12722 / SRRC 167) TaxID=332952 RepID=A0A7U2MFI8_ASPFN|nr:hypothetical protein F9C07_2766 [Aspergillus flavus]
MEICQFAVSAGVLFPKVKTNRTLFSGRVYQPDILPSIALWNRSDTFTETFSILGGDY